MKILFYDWALHTVGGGQKFNCKIAEHLSQKHQLDIITLFPVDRSNLEKLYSVDLSKIRIIHLYNKILNNPTLLRLIVSSTVSKLSRNYDLFFNADAQEAVIPQARKNIMYCHFFERRWYRPARDISDFFKLLGIYLLKIFKGNHANKYKVYCNSEYTRGWLKKLWHVHSGIIYPPVDLPQRAGKKQNWIISTGRIAEDKNYELVIEIFKQAKLKNFKLLICGKADNAFYLRKLKSLASGEKIEFRTNLEDKQLKEIYSKSKIFIQAKGFSVDENKFPELLEHFGMTTAEAMANGVVPLVLNKGGYKETVDEKSGFRFNNIKEAIENLIMLAANPKLMVRMSREARKRAKLFSLERMQNQIDEII